jgi:predicted nucleotidyltransferase
MPEISLALLFGSYAKGLAAKESDIDIYVETPDSKVRRQLEQKHSSLSVKIGKFDTGSMVIREIMKDHVIIKGVEIYFDKTGLPAETA